MSDMLFQREFECPSCGSPIPQRTPGARTLICSYCGQTSHLNADSLQAAGEKHLLVDHGSSLAIGQQRFVPILDQQVLILGRLRIDYEDGFWDEWYGIDLDKGEGYWIQEDDGQFVVFRAEKELDSSVAFGDIPVGHWNDLNGQWESFFITSKSKAQVNGGEGELPFRIIPGEPADFIEGIWKGRIISVEMLPDGNTLFVGIPIELAAMAIS